MFGRNLFAVLALLLPLLSLGGCQKTEYAGEESVQLLFSADTLSFDTVFVTYGTATRSVKVYNPTKQPVLLSSVTLSDGRASRFRLNVDGDTSLVARNVEIGAGDSIFIFAQACIDPNDATSPFLVEDAIVFGNGQRLPLTAWGRNAVYHKRAAGSTAWYAEIDCAAWRHDRPHVLVDPCAVLDGNTLVLTAGDELYFAPGALLVIDSNARLDARGTAEQPVLFSSLRHDGWYTFLPGQWQTVWFYNCSVGNVIDHAVIENGTGGLRGYPGSELTVSNTVIRNMSDCGIIGQGATITGSNLLVYDCLSSLTVLCGGSYDFSRCTFADYWTYDIRKIESVVLCNYMIVDAAGHMEGGDLVKADFTDCIVWGTYSPSEMLLTQAEGWGFNCSVVHSIVKGGEWNEDPLFEDPHEDDYHLQEGSPATGIGYNFDY